MDSIATGRATYLERAALCEHLASCDECDASLAEKGKPLALCATGAALWDAFQQAKMAPRRDALLSVAYNEAGEITGVAGMDKAGLLAVHNYLGTHKLGCHGPECGCVAFGLDAGREQGREALR